MNPSYNLLSPFTTGDLSPFTPISFPLSQQANGQTLKTIVAGIVSLVMVVNSFTSDAAQSQDVIVVVSGARVMCFPSSSPSRVYIYMVLL
jgi:hypothetical protein